MKLLLVEDHAELASNVISYLAKEGYVCEWCNSYQKAINKLSGFEYDIIMLDLMLPDGDGLDILRFIKQQNADAGVLILSAKNALDDKIQGLDLGADDYLPKPFHLSELNARLKAIYRRRHLGGAHDIIFNEISLNTDTMEVKVNDQYLDLTRKEYEMLLYMIVNKSRVLTKQSIAEHLWGDYMDSVDSFDFVYQHIKNLRKKIVQAGGHDYIQTMYGSGYKFNPNI
ncbi:response regulator transcription factor [Fulvivirga ulvae]|uniref:response regulator transcription factor n=1 Tax=Fulvivirga ulvae TaxID=2904245 RepID=UPI001F43F6B4|nr:response regulator transcription factor [Fulvivirga ulvae]UII32337.1 response regulator transcription factor [Fulvivirga ulvae]